MSSRTLALRCPNLYHCGLYVHCPVVHPYTFSRTIISHASIVILTLLCATLIVLYSKHRQTSLTCMCGDVTRSRGNKMDSDCEAQGYPRNFYITSPLFHSHLLTITNQIGQIQSGTSGGCVKAVQCRRRVLPASEEYSYIITS